MSLRMAVCLVLLAGGSLTAQQRGASASPPGGFQISGTLVDAVSGAPLVHGRVVVAPVTRRGDFTTIVTGDDGRFLFKDLAPGKYSLTAQARGYLTQSFNQHDTFSTAIVVGPDLDSSNLVFRLPHEGSITGVVTDEAGEPVREALVMLYFTGLSAGLQATRLQAQAVSDDQGAYHFSHLAPGRYLVVVRATPWYAVRPRQRQRRFIAVDRGVSATTVDGQEPGAEPENLPLDVAYPITYYDGVTDPARASPIVLGRGERAVADVNLHAVPALHLRINMDNSSGSTAVSLERRVLDGPAIPIPADVRGDSKGKLIYGIPPGHYIIKTYAVGKPGNPVVPAATEVDVNHSGALDFNDQAGNYIPVSADVHFDSVAPRQASLQLLNKKTREAFFAPAGNGGDVVFKQGLVPGSYEVSLLNAPDVYLKSISAAGAKVAGRTIEVASGTAVKLTVTAVRGEGEVTGVALRNARPFAGAMIVLVPADPAHNEILFRRDQSDSDGTFTLPSVVPGDYTALAIENGWEMEWTNPEVLKNYLGQGVAVRVQPKGKYEIKVAVHETGN